MTIGKVTTANFTPPSFSTERDRFRKEMNEKLNKIVQSNSIYEDVYKLRDEFKEIQKFMEGFQKKLKKVFEI